MSFEEAVLRRSAAEYADFLLPLLSKGARVLDSGCGPGTITVGLAESAGRVVGLDRSPEDLREAATHLQGQGIPNVDFVAAEAERVPFASDAFDAVLLHSVLEAVASPAVLLREAMRVLVPGGFLAAASVDYGGRVLAGPRQDVLERFYQVREQLWAREGRARPRSGRDLRGLLGREGFTGIDATARYFSYGNDSAVREFGRARARDCADPWFVSRSVAHELATPEELAATKRAWEEWSESADAFFAFSWCRVVGRKPRLI